MHAASWFRRALRALVLVTGIGISGAASALPLVGPFTPGFIGAMDNRAALLVGFHPGETEPFYDVFAFTVDGASGLFGTTYNIRDIDASIAPEDAATIVGIGLFDSDGLQLAGDGDGSDGFSLGALLPGAGSYGLLVVGFGGTGAGIYAGLLVSESVARVDAPASAGLAALSLLLMVPLLRRRG